MAYELFYTSVARGLRPGTSGFCTVAHTVGMPPPLIRALEAASTYQGGVGGGPVTDAANQTAAAAAAVTHWRLPTSDTVYSVLSCVRPLGLDHTRRANKLAHHLVLAPHERPPAGPAWTVARAGLLSSEWTGQPRLLPPKAGVPQGDGEPAPCAAWQAAAGDAGWAGVVAVALLASPRVPVSIGVPAGTDALPLAAEVIALLAPERRWDVTFATRGSSAGVTAGPGYAMRFVPAGVEAARSTGRPVGGLVLDLTRPPGPAPDTEAAEAARRGDGVRLDAAVEAERGDGYGGER